MLHTVPCVIPRAPEQGVATAPGFPIAGGRRSGVVPCDNAPVATFLDCVHPVLIQGACVQTDVPPVLSASSLLPRPVWLHLVLSAASIVRVFIYNETGTTEIYSLSLHRPFRPPQ